MKYFTADRVFSKYIRERDDWTCQKCGNKYEKGSRGLQNSHYFGRGRWTTRYDEDNCDALCHGCHRFWEKTDREAYREHMVDKLGEERYEKLTERARKTLKDSFPYKTKKQVKKEATKKYREKLKEWEEK